FPKGARPYLITLRKDAVSPFSSATRPPRAPGKGADEEEESRSARDPVEVRIDFEGIENRVIPFPVPEGRYGRILAVRGRAVYTNFPVTARFDEADRDADSQEGSVHYWDFEKNKSGQISDRVNDIRLSLDARVLSIRSGNRIRALPATAKE